MRGGIVFMKYYHKQIKNAVHYLEYGELPYKNSIIIGDNASGKSEVVKKVIEKFINSERKVYFIDAVNRTFDVKNVNNSIENVKFSEKITRSRVKDINFNLQDTWTYYGTDQERIEIIYPYFEKEVQSLFKEFTGTSFQIELKETGEVLYDSGEIGKVSSGYQAIIRVMLELVYVRECTRNKEEYSEIIVFIDELDEYLSPKSCSKIYPFLMQNFHHFKFVITTHSADLISTASDVNILVLKNDTVEVLDANDFSNLEDVINMFKTIFGRIPECEKKYDDQLRRLLNNKIVGIWEEEDEVLLKKLEEQDLSNAQKFLYRQIKEW